MSYANIFQLAENNSGNLEKAWENTLSCLTGDDTDHARGFYDHVRTTGGITINLKQDRLKKFLDDGVYLNVHRIAETLAERNLSNIEDELRNKLKTFYRRRTIIDSHFESGHDFIYGALNLGGLGAVKYGDYCLALKLENIVPRVAYLVPVAVAQNANNNNELNAIFA